MKKTLFFVAILFVISCSEDDDNSAAATNIALITGIDIRSSEFSEPTRLGNPNVFTNNQFITYPNPVAGALSLLASDNISDVWLIPANAEKIYQQTNFNAILNSSLYTEAQVESNSQKDFTDLNATNIVLNLENLASGYYRVFVKINGTLYWDNIYLPKSDFEIDNLISYWN